MPWKYRIGNYRVICEIKDEEVTVLIVRIGHLSKVYGGHSKCYDLISVRKVDLLAQIIGQM